MSMNAVILFVLSLCPERVDITGFQLRRQCALDEKMWTETSWMEGAPFLEVTTEDNLRQYLWSVGGDGSEGVYELACFGEALERGQMAMAHDWTGTDRTDR